jgi:hypothetical protein
VGQKLLQGRPGKGILPELDKNRCPSYCLSHFYFELENHPSSTNGIVYCNALEYFFVKLLQIAANKDLRPDGITLVQEKKKKKEAPSSPNLNSNAMWGRPEFVKPNPADLLKEKEKEREKSRLQNQNLLSALLGEWTEFFLTSEKPHIQQISFFFFAAVAEFLGAPLPAKSYGNHAKTDMEACLRTVYNLNGCYPVVRIQVLRSICARSLLCMVSESPSSHFRRPRQNLALVVFLAKSCYALLRLFLRGHFPATYDQRNSMNSLMDLWCVWRFPWELSVEFNDLPVTCANAWKYTGDSSRMIPEFCSLQKSFPFLTLKLLRDWVAFFSRVHLDQWERDDLLPLLLCFKMLMQTEKHSRSQASLRLQRRLQHVLTAQSSGEGGLGPSGSGSREEDPGSSVTEVGGITDATESITYSGDKLPMEAVVELLMDRLRSYARQSASPTGKKWVEVIVTDLQSLFQVDALVEEAHGRNALERGAKEDDAYEQRRREFLEANGKLNAEGRTALRQGRLRRRPAELADDLLRGDDPRTRPIRSWENGTLVRLAFGLSQRMERHVGWRINLRWCGSYYSCAFFVVVGFWFMLFMAGLMWIMVKGQQR